jgi:capsular exopolysaccharide synthesis family protein
VPTEGKSITIMNLGLTLSGSYRRRVLLVDADLRSPSLHRFFGLANRTGLSDGLRLHDAAISPVAVSPYLSVLPAGNPDPNPLASLTSDRMQSLIGQAASSYDWVLVDAPPVSLLPDAHHLARLVDGVLLVIAAHATPYAVIDRTLTELDPDRILGVVLNRAADTTIPAARFHGGSR